MTQWGLDTLFNPAKRHMDEEKRRLQSTREEVGDSSGGKRIDLESGKVRISKADEDSDEDADADAAGDVRADEPAQTGGASGDAVGRGKRAPGKAAKGGRTPEPSAAAIRAAARRGRQPR